MADWRALGNRVVGKWQIPLLGAALVLFALSVIRMIPKSTQRPLPEAIRELTWQVETGRYADAFKLAGRLISREDATGADRGRIHQMLARGRYEWVAKHGVPSAAVGSQIIEHFDAAARFRQPLSASDFQKMGRAFEWQGAFADAVGHYTEALARGVEGPHDVRQRVLSLRLTKLHTPPSLASEMLDDFLGLLEDERLDLRIWAIERQLDAYESLGRLAESATLLTRHADSFSGSDFEERFEYLEAWSLYKTGHYDEAEVHLRSLRNRLDREDEVYGMSGWLLGRVVMSDGGPQRPQEALSFFTDVLNYHARGAYSVASRIGSAEALVMLQRHAEALDAYRFAVEDLASLDDPYPVNRDALRTSLGVAAEAQRQAQRFKDAIAYARSAVSLVDRDEPEIASLFIHQLAQLQYLNATLVEGWTPDGAEPSSRPAEARTEEGRKGFADAAATYISLTQLTALNERRAADATWWAAELYARAGERERAVELYRSFSVERPGHPLVPRALLRIGQLHRLSRQLKDAVSEFQECYRRFPRTLEGSRALVPLAQSYMAMGPAYNELAEKTLRIVLEDSEVFTPQAAEFTDAMFLLGDVLVRNGQHERAIAVLEETLERYPSDPRVWEARFRLAGAFQKSGMTLKADAQAANSPGELEKLRVEAADRFQTARRIYREFIARYERRDPRELDQLEQTYLRHAYLYEADCFFETQAYPQALTLYEQVAGVYKDTPSALAAYVQIINSNVFLGSPDEARAALARALVLVEAIPDEAFRASLSPERRSDWKRYLEWLGKSEIF